MRDPSVGPPGWTRTLAKQVHAAECLPKGVDGFGTSVSRYGTLAEPYTAVEESSTSRRAPDWTTATNRGSLDAWQGKGDSYNSALVAWTVSSISYNDDLTMRQSLCCNHLVKVLRSVGMYSIFQQTCMHWQVVRRKTAHGCVRGRYAAVLIACGKGARINGQEPLQGTRLE